MILLFHFAGDSELVVEASRLRDLDVRQLQPLAVRCLAVDPRHSPMACPQLRFRPAASDCAQCRALRHRQQSAQRLSTALQTPSLLPGIIPLLCLHDKKICFQLKCRG